MERFCIHRDADGRYLLYLSYVDPADGRWRIDVAQASSPDGFDVRSAQPVLNAAETGVDAVKDPYVIRVGPAYYMYVSTFLTAAGPAPTSLAVSLDGLRFHWLGETLGSGGGLGPLPGPPLGDPRRSAPASSASTTAPRARPRTRRSASASRSRSTSSAGSG